MHCLSSVYSVTTPLRVSGLLVACHQEVTVYICDSWYVVYVLVDCQRAWLEPGSLSQPQGQNVAERIISIKIQMIQTEIEPLTFRLLAQCLNLLRHQQRATCAVRNEKQG
jgi:hypothetical protein